MNASRKFMELADRAISFDKTFRLIWPDGTKEIMRIEQFLPHEQFFAVREKEDIKIATFVIWGKVYFIPVTQADLLILRDNMFTTNKHLVVPFLDGELPEEEALKNKWLQLMESARS